MDGRIGRTGRAGAQGNSYTFFTHDKGKMAKPLVNILREAGQPIPDELQRMAGSGGGVYGFGGSGANSMGKGGGKRRW